MATIIRSAAGSDYVLCGIPAAFDSAPQFHFKSITSEIVLANPLFANGKIKNSPLLKNKIALVVRGECNFTDKYKRIVETNASALIIANNDTISPTSIVSMHGQLPKIKRIPCCMISWESYQSLKILLDSDNLDATDKENKIESIKFVMEEMTVDHVNSLLSQQVGPAIRSATVGGDLRLLRAILAREIKHFGKGNDSAAYNEKDHDRNITSIHIAVELNRMDCLSCLLQAQPDTDIPRSDGFVPLHIAATKGLETCLSLLLSNGAFVDYPHTLGWTALHFAAQNNFVECGELLIAAGANVQYQAMDGITPLHVAVLYGKYNFISLLMENGADRLCPCRNENSTPLSFAILREDITAQNILGEITNVPQQLHRLMIDEIGSTDLEEARGFYLQSILEYSSAEIKETDRLLIDKNNLKSKMVSTILNASKHSKFPILDDRKKIILVDIASNVRKDLWSSLLLHDMADTAELTVSLDPKCKLLSQSQVESRVSSMEVDLSRCRFSKYCDNRELNTMRDIIVAWLDLDFRNEYRQGLTTIIAPLLEIFGLDCKDQVLNCLKGLLEFQMCDFFRMNSSMDNFKSRFNTLYTLLLYWDPLVANHLLDHGIEPEFFAVPWYVTLFADILQMEEVIKLWDFIFLQQKSFLTVFAVSILITNRKRILAALTQSDLLMLFANINSGNIQINVDKCLATSVTIYRCTPGNIILLDEKIYMGNFISNEYDLSTDVKISQNNAEYSINIEYKDYVPSINIEDGVELGNALVVVDIRECNFDKHQQLIDLFMTKYNNLETNQKATFTYQPLFQSKGQLKFCCKAMKKCIKTKTNYVNLIPPIGLRDSIGKHVAVYADDRDIQLSFVHMLQICGLPFVSMLNINNV